MRTLTPAIRGRARPMPGRLVAALAAALLPLLLGPVAGCAIDLAPGPAPSPTSSPTIPADGPATLLLLHTVPWGTLQIDGQSATARGLSLETPQLGPPAPTFTLPSGRHQLTYRAEPFPAVSCTVSVPAANDDTCPLVMVPPHYPVQGADGSRILDMGSTLDGLSDAEREALLAAVALRLGALSGGDASATVTAGQHYLAADGALAIAAAPLRALPLYPLDTDMPRHTPALAGACTAVCERPPGSTLDARLWGLEAHVRMRWRYFDAASGAVILDGAPAANPPDAGAVWVPLAVGRHAAAASGTPGTWEVAIPTPEIPGAAIDCAVASNMLSQAVQVAKAAGKDLEYRWQPIAGHPAARGCLLAGTAALPSTSSRTASAAPTAGAGPHLLYRCGVLLAVDDDAHRLFQALPQAAPSEQEVAQQLVPGGAGG